VSAISAEATGHYVVIGKNDGAVQVIDLELRRVVSVFQTIFDPHGNRVAMVSGAPPMVIAGAWEKQGIAGYDALTGSLLWQRKDLRHVQGIRSLNQNTVSVELEGQPVRVLQATDGADIAKIAGVQAIYALSGGRSILAGSEWVGIGDSEFSALRKIPLESFSAMDGVLSPDLGAVGEVGGRLLVLDANGGQLATWSAPGNVITKVSWEATSNEWLCVINNPATGARQLVRTSQDARFVRALPLDNGVYYEEFLSARSRLALLRFMSPMTTLEIIDTQSGQAEWMMAVEGMPG